jgi:hypothetical protein
MDVDVHYLSVRAAEAGFKRKSSGRVAVISVQ